MSSPIHHAQDLDAALMSAPPWLRRGARDGGRDPASEERPTLAAAPPLEAAPTRWRAKAAGKAGGKTAGKTAGAFSGDLAMAKLQQQLALHPDEVPAPPGQDPQSLWPIAKRVGAVAAVAAIVAWGVISVPGSMLLRNETRPAGSPTTALSVNTDTVEPAMAPARSAPAVQALINHGLAEANALPQQQPVETPPPVLPQSLLPQPVPPLPPTAPPEPGSSPAAATTPQLGTEEIATLVKRGRDYLADGDLSSARLLLRRAAEAGNADAALALGASYDPLFLRRLGAIGAAPDPAQARQWYQKSADLGSAAASAQLAKLAQAPQ
jgi:hypothetical protein